jgi:hypothetical protein
MGSSLSSLSTAIWGMSGDDSCGNSSSISRCAYLECGIMECGIMECGIMECGIMECGIMECGIMECGIMMRVMGQCRTSSWIDRNLGVDHPLIDKYVPTPMPSQQVSQPQQPQQPQQPLSLVGHNCLFTTVSHTVLCSTCVQRVFNVCSTCVQRVFNVCSMCDGACDGAMQGGYDSLFDNVGLGGEVNTLEHS